MHITIDIAGITYQELSSLHQALESQSEGPDPIFRTRRDNMEGSEVDQNPRYVELVSSQWDKETGTYAIQVRIIARARRVSFFQGYTDSIEVGRSGWTSDGGIAVPRSVPDLLWNALGIFPSEETFSPDPNKKV